MSHHVRKIDGEIYYFRVHRGEQAGTAFVLVSAESADATGVFIVKPGGNYEPGDDLPGFTTNPTRRDGLWPEPPTEALQDATEIARTSAERQSF